MVTPAQARRWGMPLALLALLLLGAGLRFHALDARSLWLDEAFSVWLARHPLLAMWGWILRIDQHPPLYYTLLHAWQGLTGEDEVAVRALSALVSTLTLPLFYAFSRRVSRDPVTALLATLLLAVSPFHVAVAQEARMYSLLALAVMATLFFLAPLLDPGAQPPRGWRRLVPWLGLSVSQAGVMLTHHTGALFFPLALNLPILAALASRRGRSQLPPGFARSWLRSQLLALLLWSPWAVPAWIQTTGVLREFWIPPVTWEGLWRAARTFSFAHLPDSSPWINPALLIWLLLLGLGVGRLGRSLWTWLLLSLFLTPVLGEIGVSFLVRSIFHQRSLIGATLPAILLVALGLRRLRPRPLLLGVLAGILALNGLGLARFYRAPEREAWDDVAAFLAQEAEPGALILFNAGWTQLPFEYYFREMPRAGQVTLHGLPVDPFADGRLEPKMTPGALPRLRRLVQGRERVWLVYSHEWYTDPQELIRQELTRLLGPPQEWRFQGVRVLIFGSHP